MSGVRGYAQYIPPSQYRKRLQERHQRDVQGPALRRNREITSGEVRVVHPDKSNEVMSLSAALAEAQKAGLDLVEVSPNATPPVCRLVNYESLLFEQKKREKEQRKKEVERKRRDDAKEVQFRPFIAQHDLEVKLGQVDKFLAKGHKVKLLVKARGYKERLAAQETLTYLKAQVEGKARLVAAPQGGRQGGANAFIAMLEPLTAPAE